jgi:eukaryotic-like serine/threonine-protein kinase
VGDTQRAEPRTAVQWGDPTTDGGVRGEPTLGPLAAGDVLGPYIVRRFLGQGGMGTVYAALDPRLDREVALKVLHKRADDRVLQARVMREAQALARLSHPHVVPVYDVGFERGTLWVAMELVRGPSLMQWLRQAPTWTEVIDAFVQAGRGLAAAHAAGIVHRDFKPGNAMIAGDGRVVVLDFGLAWAPGVDGALDSGASTLRGERRGPSSGRDPLAYTLTDAGAVVGTVPYMAPEQHSRREVDARVDQYALCVSIHEGLFGARPFDGPIDTIVKRKLAGPQRPLGPAHVPARVWRVIQRGLAPDPNDRWPDIATMIDALERAGRRTRVGRAAVAGVLGIGVIAAVMARPAAHVDDRCDAMDARVAEVWSPERREAIEGAFVATGKASASATWARADTRIDGAVMRWRDRAMAACTSAAKDGGGEAEVAAALACAERGIAAVDGALDVLAAPDDATVARALVVVESLPRPDCAGVVSEAAEGETRDALARGRALMSAGRLPEAVELGQEILQTTHAAGDQRGVALALLLIGGSRLDLGEWDDAEANLSDALWTAVAAGDDVSATTAATKLVHLCAMRYDPACADRWIRQAEAGLERLGPGGEPLAGRLELALGDVAMREGDLEASLAHYDRALAAVVAQVGEEGLEASSIVSSIAMVHAIAGRHELAISEFERAAWIEEGWGGRESGGRSKKLEGIAGSLLALGRIDEARERLEEALALTDAAFGPDHPHAVRMRGNLVLVLTDAGELDRALTLGERVVAQKRKLFGATDVQVAIALHNLGRVHGRRGEHELARKHHADSLVLWERTLGPDHVDLAHPLAGIAESCVELDRMPEALAAGRRAIALYEAHRRPVSAELRFALARAMWAEGDRQGARESAMQAAESIPPDMPPRPGDVDRKALMAWLQSHH